MRTDQYLDGGQSAGFEAHGLAAMGKPFVPGDIVMFAFITIYIFLHFIKSSGVVVNLSAITGET
jgi:hypothetical protein